MMLTAQITEKTEKAPFINGFLFMFIWVIGRQASITLNHYFLWE
jgi:hypothetical protein